MIRCLCLHGNFGAPSDWAPVEHALKRTFREVECVCPDLWSLGRESWRRELGEIYAAVKERGGRTVVIGYSLGARLALDMLGEAVGREAPDTVRFGGEGVIACSVNPGIRAAADREARRAVDARWGAQLRDRTVPLDDILAAWGAQPVFSGAVGRAPPRFTSTEAEARFRAVVADRFIDWSVGALPTSWDKLQMAETPVWCLAGERDTAFTTHLEGIRRLGNPHVVTAIVPGGSHRFPFEAPDRFAGAIATFLQPG